MKETVLNAKIDKVAEIQEKIEKSQSLVLLNYRGLTVEQVTEFRAECRNNGVEYKVYKNSMMDRAFTNLGYSNMKEFLEGPNAVAFSYEDTITAAKIVGKFAKKYDVIEVISGIVEGEIVDVAIINKLANLPSKEVLIAQVLGGLNSPIQGLAIALNAILEQKSE